MSRSIWKVPRSFCVSRVGQLYRLLVWQLWLLFADVGREGGRWWPPARTSPFGVNLFQGRKQYATAHKVLEGDVDGGACTRQPGAQPKGREDAAGGGRASTCDAVPRKAGVVQEHFHHDKDLLQPGNIKPFGDQMKFVTTRDFSRTDDFNKNKTKW